MSTPSLAEQLREATQTLRPGARLVTGPQLEPDLFAIATMLHALANTFGPCHTCPITVPQPRQPTTLLDLIEQEQQ